MAIKKVGVTGTPMEYEYKADAAITPGDLLEITSTGVKVHATAGGRALPIFAGIDKWQGRDIDDDYAASDRVNVQVYPPGSIVNALIKDGEDIAVWDFLESGDGGDLREVDTDSGVAGVVTGSVIAVALEALDLTGSSTQQATDRRCKVMIK